MKKAKILVAVVGLFWVCTSVQAQNEPPMYNENSIQPIAEYEQLFKKRLWQRMDLHEKQNLSFFAYNKEISRFIIDAVKRGELQPYKNDSLRTRMTRAEFLENLELPDYGGGGDADSFGFEETASDDGGWGDTGGGWGDEPASNAGNSTDTGSGTDTGSPSGQPDYFLPTAVSMLEIMEDMIFDKRRSRLYYDIQSIKLIIPAENFETGLFREIGVFKYKDLEELFRKYPEEAIWFNPQNSAEHKNFADAFALRLQSTRIIKIQNTENEQIIDIYDGDPRRALIASKQLEYELMEFEHNLWEQ